MIFAGIVVCIMIGLSILGQFFIIFSQISLENTELNMRGDIFGYMDLLVINLQEVIYEFLKNKNLRL